MGYNVRSCPIADKMLRCRECPLCAISDRRTAANNISIRSPCRRGQVHAGATTEHRSPRHSGPGQYRSVAMPRTCTTTLGALRVVLCDRLGIRYNAGQIVRYLQAHTSCQSESALAGEGALSDWHEVCA